jgi:hypothetical protein
LETQSDASSPVWAKGDEHPASRATIAAAVQTEMNVFLLRRYLLRPLSLLAIWSWVAVTG